MAIISKQYRLLGLSVLDTGKHVPALRKKCSPQLHIGEVTQTGTWAHLVECTLGIIHLSAGQAHKIN
jgi:hypothetical protein